VASHTVRLHPLAADEVEGARAWYLARNPTVAGAFLLELDAAIANIAEGPKRWPRIHGRFGGIWGRYDPSQLATEPAAYGRDLPHAEIHVMDAGHFALDLAPDADAIAERPRDFLGRNGL
jgi:pimeloyl-ACP methyl ester carboxylesterase